MDDFMDFWGGSYIVPPDYPSSPTRQPSPAISQAPSYETPWWVDTINRGIERAAQVASIDVGGYPPYPQFPAPQPVSHPEQGIAPQPHEGIQLSQTTLMLIVGGVLLFMLGRRR